MDDDDLFNSGNRIIQSIDKSIDSLKRNQTVIYDTLNKILEILEEKEKNKKWGKEDEKRRVD